MALLENSAVTGMADLSARLIHRDWSVITITDGCQVDTKRIWLLLCAITSLLFSPPPLSLFSSLFVRQLLKHPHHTHVQRWTEWHDADSNHQHTEQQADTLATRLHLAAVQPNFISASYLSNGGCAVAIAEIPYSCALTFIHFIELCTWHKDHYHLSVNATTCSCLHSSPLESASVFCSWVQC